MRLVVSADRRWMEERLHLDKEEVDAAMWLSPVVARLVAEDAVREDCPSELEATVLDNSGDQRRVKINSSVMTNTVSDKYELLRVMTQWFAGSS